MVSDTKISIFTYRLYILDNIIYLGVYNENDSIK